MAERWGVVRTAVVAIAAAVLTGCASEQQASDTLPSTSTSASATEEALPPLGPADFPMPDEAREKTPEGAEAFVRYYIGLINRTAIVLDAAPLRELSAGCTDCDRIARLTEEDAAAGYHYEGGQFTITWIDSAAKSSDEIHIAFVADLAALTVIDPAGQPLPNLSTAAKTDLSSGAITRWDSERATWLITALTLG
ncbi:DUF6318 family protein [Blastococcus sp. SYSU D00820]